MAVATYIHFNPSSGAGDTSVEITADAYTGRVQRSTTATFSVAGATPATLDIIQTGKPEFVTMASAMAADRDGGPITISGKSNSTKLTFSITEADMTITGLTLPADYTAGGSKTNNGVDIASDPGASQEFDFSITIQVPDNVTIDEHKAQLVVTDAGGHTATCMITQPGDDPRIALSASSVTLDYTGAAQSVNVITNTNWTVA